MASKAARYGVGIGTGAASGAATGASIGGPWGALIGGVVGGGAGAISAAVQNGDEDREKRRMLERQARERRMAQIMLLRSETQKYGGDTTAIDAEMERQGMDLSQAAESRQFGMEHQLDPNAFVGMATAGAKAAGGIYKAANAPEVPQQQPLQLTGVPTMENPGQYGDYQIDDERLRQARGLA